MSPPPEDDKCPCFSGYSFAECCAGYLSGQKAAPTAEALMRSRYAAFATNNVDYLEATLLPEKRNDFNRDDASLWSRSSEWTGLEIMSVQKGGENDFHGIVEFVAHYRLNGQDLEHRERSRFLRKDNVWYYVDGTDPTLRGSKAGRNDPCPCGSGKKYKKCCRA